VVCDPLDELAAPPEPLDELAAPPEPPAAELPAVPEPLDELPAVPELLPESPVPDERPVLGWPDPHALVSTNKTLEAAAAIRCEVMRVLMAMHGHEQRACHTRTARNVGFVKPDRKRIVDTDDSGVNLRTCLPCCRLVGSGAGSSEGSWVEAEVVVNAPKSSGAFGASPIPSAPRPAAGRPAPAPRRGASPGAAGSPTRSAPWRRRSARGRRLRR
jgi:hypothetical protein